MTEQKAHEYYLQPLYKAEELLKGPDEVRISGAYWGWPNLSLRIEVAPKILGTLESRIIYADLEDITHDKAILWQASYDANAERKRVFQAHKSGKQLVMADPKLSSRAVWISINWLQEAVQHLDKLVIPIHTPDTISTLEWPKKYSLKLRRYDGTALEVSWFEDWSDDFVALTNVWKLIWTEMTTLLETGVLVRLEEIRRLHFDYYERSAES
jgi:hypothetical protein